MKQQQSLETAHPEKATIALGRLAAHHAQQLSAVAEGLQHHPDRAAVDRLMEALSDAFACERRLATVERPGAGLDSRALREIESLYLMAIDAHVRADAAARELGVSDAVAGLTPKPMRVPSSRAARSYVVNG
jgi:hypothetical protein